MTQNFSASDNKARWARLGRRFVVLIVGGSVLGIGIAMLVLPGPAILFIPLGLAILAVEFPWARLWLSRARRFLRQPSKKLG